MANSRVPDNIHHLRGTYQTSRHGKPDEKPQLPEKAPECPEWLGDIGREKWQHLCDTLAGTGLLTDIDDGLLLQYCHLWDRLVRCSKGEVINKDGFLVPFSASEHAAMHRIGCELGIGALSRSKIKVTPSKEKPKPEGWAGL